MDTQRSETPTTEYAAHGASLAAAADALSMAEAMLQNGADPWELLVSAGIEWRANIDEGRWRIGDAALLIDKRYGDDTIAKYAASINVTKSSVEQYRTVCGFWGEKSKRLALRSMANVTYTHFLHAMRLKDVDAAAAFVVECSDNDWTADQAYVEVSKRLGKPVPPKKLIDTKIPIKSWGRLTVSFMLTPDQAIKLMDYYKDGKPVRLVIHEVPDAAAVAAEAAAATDGAA